MKPTLKINNSKDAAIYRKDSHWSNPGAAFYDRLLQSFYFASDEVNDPRNLSYQDYLKEAYLIAPLNNIKNSSHGVTPYSRSGCKYPHHEIKGDELVVNKNGLKAAYLRARQMKVFKGAVKEHLMRHIKELDMEEEFNVGKDDLIEENFNWIESYLSASEASENDRLFSESNNDGKVYEVKKSKISGKGTFAIKDIESGTNIGLAVTKIKDTGNPDDDFKRTELCQYTNHSSAPNLELLKPDADNRYYFRSIKFIKAGTELTLNYEQFDFDGIRGFDESTDEPTPEPAEEPAVKPEEPPKKEESLPKQTDSKEKGANGVKRKELYIDFIKYAKTIHSNNLFGSIFDKNAFDQFSFVPHEMQYFYRLANPLLCVLKDSLTFFALSELKKINSENPDINKLLIFAADKSNKLIVFNQEDKKIYQGESKDKKITCSNELASSFDTYIENLVGVKILETCFMSEVYD